MENTIGGFVIRPKRRIAILQSAYIPWKGYFDIIGSVDAFVIYDDVQYSKNHWHNRNQIKTQAGLKWLTIPVATGDESFQPIDKVKVGQSFARKHWRSVAQSYARAPFFNSYRSWLAELYGRAEQEGGLSAINVMFLKEICAELGISTPFLSSGEMGIGGGQSERLVNICKALGATSYLSGPSARNYLDRQMFDAAGIDVKWMDYSNYPEYGQLHGDFAHGVTVLDLLLNAGPEANAYMKWQKEA